MILAHFIHEKTFCVNFLLVLVTGLLFFSSFYLDIFKNLQNEFTAVRVFNNNFSNAWIEAALKKHKHLHFIR